MALSLCRKYLFYNSETSQFSDAKNAPTVTIGFGFPFTVTAMLLISTLEGDPVGFNPYGIFK